MKLTSRFLQDQRGFTLTELLTALAMMGFVLSAALLAIQAGAQANDVNTGRAEAQANARLAMDRMLADIRVAALDPTSAGFDPVEPSTNMTSTTLTLRTDLNANGTIDTPSGTCDPNQANEKIRYRLSGTSLMRSADPTNANCEAALIGGVDSLTFTYMDSTGTTTTTAANVRIIGISMRIIPETVTGTQQHAMSVTIADQARIRNR